MKVALRVKIFSKIHLLIINLVRMKLQVIFISDLLKPSLNKIKECYWDGKKDRFVSSRYRWPIVKPNKKVMKIQKIFLKQITTQSRILTSPISTTDRPTNYWSSITYISPNKEYLALNQIDSFIYYQLETRRDKLYVQKAVVKPNKIIFSPCEYSISKQSIQLSLVRDSQPTTY